MFYFKILILIFSYIFCQLPSSYHIDELQEWNRSTFYSGWPNKSTLDLAIDLEQNNIFAGTSGGLAKITVPNTLSLTTEIIEESQYIVVDDNLPEGGNPAMRRYDLENGNTLIVATGVIGTIDEPAGTGVSWSLDQGENWEHMSQSIDSSNDLNYSNGYIENVDWGNQTYKHLAITTPIQNVSYDVSVDLENGYIYTASWAGMLRRFNYNNPESWEVVPLPMDNQINLFCSDGTGFSDDYEYRPTTYDNHKPFSVLIEDGYIWVGTADGINKGEILDDNCIDWTHYNDIEQSGQFEDDWIVGLYSQNLEDNLGNIFKRIWGISWVDSTTPHNLTYTDDLGSTWNKMEGLRPKGAVTYNLYSTSSPETIYASTSTGLYKTIFGCNDYAANNYANAENEECQYNEVISDGCDLQENYFYLSPVSNNLYELIYNSSEEIFNFSFDIEGASIVSNTDIIDNLFISYSNNGSSLNATLTNLQPISAGCGSLLLLELNGTPTNLDNIIVNSGCFNYYSSGTYGEECSNNDWHKIEIPDWIFDEIGIVDEYDPSFKVYSVIKTDQTSYNALWIGTNQGLLVHELELRLEGDWFKPKYHQDYSKMTIFPNPFNLNTDNLVYLYAQTTNNGYLEIYDFSMSMIYKAPCEKSGDELFCSWDGRTNNGSKVANGVYFCKISSGNKVFWEKLGLVQFK